MLIGDVIAGLVEEEDMHVAQLALVRLGSDGTGLGHIIDRKGHPELPGADRLRSELGGRVAHATRKGRRRKGRTGHEAEGAASE